MSYSKLPITSYILKKLDKDLKQLGVQGAMNKLLKRSLSKFTVEEMSQETKDALEKKSLALFIFCNDKETLILPIFSTINALALLFDQFPLLTLALLSPRV